MGLPFGEAALLFSQLTVGDGIVSQIPAYLFQQQQELLSHGRLLKVILGLTLLDSFLDRQSYCTLVLRPFSYSALLRLSMIC